MLSKVERETILLFNEGEELAEVYTHNRSLKAKLSALAKEYPKLVSFVQSNPNGGETYRLPKKLIQIRKPYSEERRQKDKQIAKEQGRVPPGKRKNESSEK